MTLIGLFTFSKEVIHIDSQILNNCVLCANILHFPLKVSFHFLVFTCFHFYSHIYTYTYTYSLILG